jgi:hypothetical protein
VSPKRWARHNEELLLALAAATPVAAGVLLGLAQVEIPDATMWDEPSDPLTVITVAIVGLAALYGLGQVIAKPVTARRAERDAKVAAAKLKLADQCRKALVPINEHFPNVRLRQIGVHVWKVADDGSQLVPLEKYTADQARIESPLKWTPGRGVVGLAWQNRVPIAETGLKERAKRARAATDEDWAALDSRKRLGLDREDFIVAESGFEAILACPLFAESGPAEEADPPVLGVFAVDFRVEVEKGRLLGLGGEQDFEDVLGCCEEVLRELPRA